MYRDIPERTDMRANRIEKGMEAKAFNITDYWRERVGIEPTLPAFGRKHRL